MNNGGVQSLRECAQQNVRRKSGPDDYSHALAKIAVAQICESEGFQSFQQSALETLSDVAAQYIISIGKVAHFHANLAGRTECDVFDIIQGLEDLALPQGFLGASDVDHCLASSGTIREIIQYVGEVGKIPFVYSIPKFPVAKDRKPTPSFLSLGEEPPGEHIPSWLPAFPDAQTYMQLPKQNERSTEHPTEKIEQARQHRKAERSLFNLHQQTVACNGSEGPFLDPTHAAKARRVAESNPFLVSPFPFGEKEVSPVVPPAKLLNVSVEENPIAENQGVDGPVSLLETISPAIESMKTSSYDFDGKKALSNQRPALKFRIGIGKKTLGASFSGILQNRVSEDISSLFTKDVEKDEKIRRVEQLLKDSMEKPEELAQL